jgi:hypothetical protein
MHQGILPVPQDFTSDYATTDTSPWSLRAGLTEISATTAKAHMCDSRIKPKDFAGISS